MIRSCIPGIIFTVVILAVASTGYAAQITTSGQPGQLDIRIAGEHSVRITLKPVTYKEQFPFTPALVERDYP